MLKPREQASLEDHLDHSIVLVAELRELSQFVPDVILTLFLYSADIYYYVYLVSAVFQSVPDLCELCSGSHGSERETCDCSDIDTGIGQQLYSVSDIAAVHAYGSKVVFFGFTAKLTDICKLCIGL